MADQQPTEQNTYEMDQSPEQNHHHPQQQQNDDEPPALNNIFYDCLEQIFEFLDLASLLNVADTCKRLQAAASTKFGHDYGNRFIYLCQATSDNVYRFCPGILALNHSVIRVNGLELCLPFLRCFGGEISRLEIDYSGIFGSRKQHLDRYINQYCADTLTRFSCRNGETFASDSFLKPFKCVEKVVLSHFNLGGHLKDFVHWFPNVQHLRMVLMTIDENAIAVPFPNLKHLCIYINKNTSSDFSNKNIVNLLHANPQLDSLELYFSEFRLSELLTIINENQLISSVVLDGEITEHNEVELSQFRSQHSSIVKIELRNSIYDLD